MYDVLYVPKLTNNLFSVNAAAQKGNVVCFGHKYCWIRKGRKLVGTGLPIGKLYKLNCDVQRPPPSEKITIAGETEDCSKIDLWHQRLGHVNLKQLRQLAKNAEGVDIPSEGKQSFCEACIQGKMHRLPHHSLKEIRSKKKLQLVYTDICGPMQTQSFGGSRYFITFTDDYSRCCKTYFIKRKSEALEKFKEFKLAVENESGMKIKALRADRGGEYMSEEFNCFLTGHGIRLESTAAYSPQQNGVSERLNQTLVEAARSHAGLSNAYWAEAVATATYIRNRMVTSALKSGQTPYQLWYGRKPSLGHIRVFGCTVYTHIERKKLDKKAQKLRFIGYTEATDNYKVWDERKKKSYVRHDVIFNESDFGKCTNTPEQEQELREELKNEVEIDFGRECDIQDQESGDTEGQEEREEQTEFYRRSQRIRKPACRYGIDEYTYQVVQKIEEPATIKEALNSNHSKEWKIVNTTL